MSFIHYLLLGHFDHDDNVVRFAKRSEGGPFEPVLSNPIASETLRSILRAMLGGEFEADRQLRSTEWGW